MNRRFDEILDECINCINSGEKLEDCLAKYPDHATELEPALRTISATIKALRNILNEEQTF